MSKYYDINKMTTNKSVLTQLKEILIGKKLMQISKSYLYYATIIDLNEKNVVAEEELFDGRYIWYIPYNSKEWILCD